MSFKKYWKKYPEGATLPEQFVGLVGYVENTTEEITHKIEDKTDKKGNHEGSWQGLNKPTLSEEGMRATVEVLDSDISLIKTSGIIVSSSLQEAIDLAPNYGDKVIITKDITENFTPYDGLTIESPNNSTITLTNKIVLNSIGNMTFRNIRFKGTEIFDLLRCHNNKFINCSFNSSDLTIIKMERCFYNVFDTCAFYGNTSNFITNSSIGINGLVINATNFKGCKFFNIKNMIVLEDTQSANILDCNFEHIGEKGVHLKSSGTGYWDTTSANIQINGCRFETAYNTSGKPSYVEGLTHHVYIGENCHNNVVENNFMQTYYADYEVLNKTVMDLGYNNKVENNGNFKALNEIKEKIYDVINYNSKGLVYNNVTNIPLGFSRTEGEKIIFTRYGNKTKFTTEGTENNIYHNVKNIFFAPYDTPVLLYVKGTFKGKFSISIKNETDNVTLFTKTFSFLNDTVLDKVMYGSSITVSRGKKYSVMLSKSTEHNDVDYPVFTGIIDEITVVNTNTPTTFYKLRENKLIILDEVIDNTNINSWWGYEVVDNEKSYKTNAQNKLV